MTTASAPLVFATVLTGFSSLVPAVFAESLKERQTRVFATIDKVRSSVVCIQSRGKVGMGSGSGVIVSKDGLVLTAAHVVDGAADGDVTVVMPDGSEVKGKVLGRDLNRDAAMVQILEKREWLHVEPAPSDSIEKGEWCVAMGHPGGFDIQRGAPVRVGRVWQNNEKAFFRSDNTVSGGDSGGPLFDLEGRVIGIHSNISMDVSENRHVPIGVFHDDWERLKKGEVWGNNKRLLAESEDLRPKSSEKPKSEKRAPAPAEDDKPAGPAKGGAWLGLALENKDESVVVGETTDGSPADTAGLERGDVIVKVNGKDVGNSGDIISRVHDSAPGDKLKFTVKRGDAEKEIVVTLGTRKE
jgi:serine protease Do